ncbi:dephospho-CoA kinase [Limnohabitans sp.]|uniref:dephospho-CoA kinase n=1 Tax=Limnohabitans sp. TaxID=1907725 RepID=UPI00286EED11|nr:dephospho-CoA kinase [Limnohabitans sp.]
MQVSLPPFRLGLTGGIGSGKSTVGQMLVDAGGALIDADAIARSVTAPGGSALTAIAQTFGPEYITAKGALDRDRMRTLVFSDTSAKQRLEAIIHPLVSSATQAQAQTAANAGHKLLVFDVPLLVESGRWRAQLDSVLVVDCEVATQIERVMTRSGLSAETVQRIIDAQATRAQRLSAADWVIFNEGLSLDDLKAKVRQIMRDLSCKV